MKKLSLLYLPLDERPCNAQFVSRIVRGTPVKVIAPPQSHLGCKKRGAEFEKIRQWLLNNAQAAQYAVISVDMLLYGGIVPSRLHHNTEEQLNKRLQTLRKLKEKKPSLKIYAFALIMRCPNYSSTTRSRTTTPLAAGKYSSRGRRSTKCASAYWMKNRAMRLWSNCPQKPQDTLTTILPAEKSI